MQVQLVFASVQPVSAGLSTPSTLTTCVCVLEVSRVLKTCPLQPRMYWAIAGGRSSQIYILLESLEDAVGAPRRKEWEPHFVLW